MQLHRLRHRLPTRAQLKNNRLLRPFAQRLVDPQLWHFNRRNTSNAMWIGLVAAWLPIPGQTLVAAITAVGFRSNLPLTVGITWISNPLTFAPMYFFAYKLGAWLLDSEPAFTQFIFSFTWIFERLAQIWQPLMLGTFVCAWVSGMTGFLVTRAIWRSWIGRRWERRSRRRGATAPQA